MKTPKELALLAARALSAELERIGRDEEAAQRRRLEELWR